MVDVLDHAINKGVVLTGELVMGIANIDLIYVRLSVLIGAADRVMKTIVKDDRSTDHGD